MIVEGSRIGDFVRDVELFVADTDVLLGDACDSLLSGHPSNLLTAMDAGAALAVMSEKTFHELGWMSAKSARGRGVADSDLRAMIEREYLRRIPVVVPPAEGSRHWMPDASDISDLDDRQHMQVARLILARIIYSHDRDIRRPGFAPATRAEYDSRVEHLAAIAANRRTEAAFTGLATLSSTAASTLVSWTSARLNIRPALAWATMAVTLAGSAVVMLAPPLRRRRIIDALAPLGERAKTSVERGAEGRRALAARGLLISPRDPMRFEVVVGAYLARNPGSHMGEIAEGLGMNADDRQQLSRILREHPSFELISQWGWAVGKSREALETFPAPDRDR